MIGGGCLVRRGGSDGGEWGALWAAALAFFDFGIGYPDILVGNGKREEEIVYLES